MLITHYKRFWNLSSESLPYNFTRSTGRYPSNATATLSRISPCWVLEPQEPCTVILLSCSRVMAQDYLATYSFCYYSVLFLLQFFMLGFFLLGTTFSFQQICSLCFDLTCPTVSQRPSFLFVFCRGDTLHYHNIHIYSEIWGWLWNLSSFETDLSVANAIILPPL